MGRNKIRRTLLGLLLTSSMVLAPGACMVRASADTQISGGQNGRQAENAQSTERNNSIESSDSTSGSVYSNLTDEVSEPDFSSCRLLVLTSGGSVIRSTDKVLSDYEGSYILQFDTPEEAEGAYQYYTKRADCVEPDSASIRAASEAVSSNAAQEKTSAGTERDRDGKDAEYTRDGDNVKDVKPQDAFTEDSNPLSELADAADSDADFSRKDVIALIDTGASNNKNIIESVSMLGDDVSDDNGHGTQMLQYITSENPDARILSIKALDKNGNGTPSSVYAAIKYAMEKKVSIINLSLSGIRTAEVSALEEVIKEAVASGITVIGAAGNDSRDAKYNIPGGIDEAVIAGAVDEEDQRTGKTNYGSTVDYYVVSGSTSEAAARLSGIYSRTGRFAKQGTVFTSALDAGKSSDEEQSGDGSDQKPEIKGSVQVKVISETENGKIIDVNGIRFLAARDFDTSVPWKITDADTESAELTAAAADLSPVACQSVNHSYGYTKGDTDKEVAFVNGTGGQGLFNFGGIESGMLNVSTGYSLMTNTGTEFYGKPHDDAFCIEEGQIFHTSWQKTTDLVGAWSMVTGTNNHQITADEVKRMALARDYAYAHNSTHADRYRDAQACVYYILGSLAYSRLSAAQKNAIAYADLYKDNATIVYARRMDGGNKQDVAIFEVKLHPVYIRIHKTEAGGAGSTAGAKYQIWYDGPGSDKGGRGTGQSFTIGSDGYSNIVELEPGHTYYYQEYAAPSSGKYQIDSSWHSIKAGDLISCTDKSRPYLLVTSDKPYEKFQGKLRIRINKTVDGSQVTDNGTYRNSDFSFEVKICNSGKDRPASYDANSGSWTKWKSTDGSSNVIHPGKTYSMSVSGVNMRYNSLDDWIGNNKYYVIAVREIKAASGVQKDSTWHYKVVRMVPATDDVEKRTAVGVDADGGPDQAAMTGFVPNLKIDNHTPPKEDLHAGLKTAAVDGTTSVQAGSTVKSTVIRDTVSFMGFKADKPVRISGKVVDPATGIIVASNTKTLTRADQAGHWTVTTKQERKYTRLSWNSGYYYTDADGKQQYEPGWYSYYPDTACSPSRWEYGDGVTSIDFTISNPQQYAGHDLVVLLSATGEVADDTSHDYGESAASGWAGTEAGYHSETVQADSRTDRNETVSYPSIQTAVTDDNSGSFVGTVGADISITDKVTYKNLRMTSDNQNKILKADGNEAVVPGKEPLYYQIKGVVIDKSTGKPYVQPDGTEVRAETDWFRPEAKDGSVNVQFKHWNAVPLSNKDIVVYEELYVRSSDGTGVLIAEHKDINDTDQTLHFPEIHTTLYQNDITGINERSVRMSGSDKNQAPYRNGSGTYTDGAKSRTDDTGSGTTTGGAEPADYITFVDKVDCHNLIPGQQYILEAKLWVKQTLRTDGSNNVDNSEDPDNPSRPVIGNYLDENGSVRYGQVTGRAVFTASEASETQNVTIRFDSNYAQGSLLVAFEDLKVANGGNENTVATHSDINDTKQSIMTQFFTHLHAGGRGVYLFYIIAVTLAGTAGILILRRRAGKRTHL